MALSTKTSFPNDRAGAEKDLAACRGRGTALLRCATELGLSLERIVGWVPHCGASLRAAPRAGHGFCGASDRLRQPRVDFPAQRGKINRLGEEPARAAGERLAPGVGIAI